MVTSGAAGFEGTAFEFGLTTHNHRAPLTSVTAFFKDIPNGGCAKEAWTILHKAVGDLAVIARAMTLEVYRLKMRFAQGEKPRTKADEKADGGGQFVTVNAMEASPPTGVATGDRPSVAASSARFDPYNGGVKKQYNARGNKGGLKRKMHGGSGGGPGHKGNTVKGEERGGKRRCASLR